MKSVEIRKRLREKGIKVLSVRSGRGSAYGWIYVKVARARDLRPAQAEVERLTGKYGKVVVEVV